ncbi:retrovirus-related pol polyprotein from transposon TNT 1-94 [Tanacetum coccineum]
MKRVTIDFVIPKVLATGMYAIDVEPIPPRCRNNREVHLDYLKHLKESVEILSEIVEEARVERPLDRSLASACLYTKHSQELLEYVIGACPKDFNKQDKKHATTPLNKKKQVTFKDQSETSNNTTQKHIEQMNIQKTNVYVITSTGVNSCTDASGSKPRSNTKKNRISPAKSVNKKKVEEHPRINKSSRKKLNRVDSSISLKRAVINSNSRSGCTTFKKVWKPKQVWKATRKLLTNVGYQWKPTRRKFTLREQCPLTSHTSQKPLTRYQRRNKQFKAVPASIPTPTENQAIDASMQSAVVQIIIWYLDSGCSKHMTGNRSRLRNFVKKFIGTVRFRNDHFGAIMGYGDYVIGDSVISKVYYVEGLGHSLFSVGKFCDSDLEVAFRKHSCYVRDTDGVELFKASKNKSWLWHYRLNHLNFGTINDLARKDLVRGVPRLKFEKDHLCSAYQLGNSKKHTHKPKAENTIMEVLHTLHMDLCEPMLVQSINGKKYILVIVDDYSRFTWVTKFLMQIQFGIFHQKSVPRTPQQNDVVERRNRTLIEAARTMLIFSKALMFLWAEAVATAFFGALCYHTNNNEDLGKLQPTTDIGIFVDYAPSRKGYQIYNKRAQRIMETIHVQFDELSEPMAHVQLGTGPAPSLLTPRQISLLLVPNPVHATPYVPPTNKELEILFQPMFNEYLEPPRVERPIPLALAVQVPVNSAGTPSSTTIDQDAPSTSHSPSSSALQSSSS